MKYIKLIIITTLFITCLACTDRPHQKGKPKFNIGDITNTKIGYKRCMVIYRENYGDNEFVYTVRFINDTNALDSMNLYEFELVEK